jgi:hypothetical protein
MKKKEKKSNKSKKLKFNITVGPAVHHTMLHTKRSAAVLLVTFRPRETRKARI